MFKTYPMSTIYPVPKTYPMFKTYPISKTYPNLIQCPYLIQCHTNGGLINMNSISQIVTPGIKPPREAYSFYPPADYAVSGQRKKSQRQVFFNQDFSTFEL